MTASARKLDGDVDALPRETRGTPRWHALVDTAIAAVAAVSVIAILLIFVFVGREAWPVLASGEVSFGDLFAPSATGQYVWQPVSPVPKLNVVALVFGSLKIGVLSLLIAVPLALGSALFVSEVLPARYRAWVKVPIELLAGVPSVVLGFLALTILADATHDLFGTTYRLNALLAAIALSLAVVPLVFTVSEDALRAVPRSMREAAAALGAERYQIALRVVMPAAAPGIFAAIALGLGRALGETMIVLMASGNAAVLAPGDPTSSARTIAATIAAELGEAPAGGTHWRLLFFLGALLFALTFVLSSLGQLAITRMRRRLGGVS